MFHTAENLRHVRPLLQRRNFLRHRNGGHKKAGIAPAFLLEAIYLIGSE
jgi:hypothetical protein